MGALVISIRRKQQIAARIRHITPSRLPLVHLPGSTPHWRLVAQARLLGNATWPRPRSFARLATLAACAGAVGAVLCWEIFPEHPFAVLATFLSVAVATLRFIAQFDQRAQSNAFLNSFPNSLDVLVRNLRIGKPLDIAIADVAAEYPAPVGPIFAEITGWMHVGLPLAEAVTNVSERLAIKEFEFFGAAVSIQYDSGGNIVEFVQNLAGVIRERQLALLRGRAAASQARITARILIAIPLVLTLGFLLFQPGYFAPLVSGSRTGWILLGYAVASFAAGVWFINRYLKRFLQV